MDRVSYQVLLDCIVEGRVSREGRRLVHLQEPGLTLGVDEDVET